MNTSWDMLRTATSVCEDGKFKFCDLYGNGYNETGLDGGLPFVHKTSCASKPQRFSISCHKPWPRSSALTEKYFCCLWLWRKYWEGLRRGTMWRQRNNYNSYNHRELLSSQSKPWSWQCGGADLPQAPHKGCSRDLAPAMHSAPCSCPSSFLWQLAWAELKTW